MATMLSSQPLNRDSSPDERFENLLSEHDVARIVRLSVAAIRRWRLVNSGPPFLKLGSAVRYDPRALREWLTSHHAGGERGREASHE
jgi:hypothetical protein